MEIDELTKKLGPIYVEVDDKIMLSGKWAAYAYETFGLSPENFADIINNFVEKHYGKDSKN